MNDNSTETMVGQASAVTTIIQHHALHPIQLLVDVLKAPHYHSDQGALVIRSDLDCAIEVRLKGSDLALDDRHLPAIGTVRGIVLYSAGSIAAQVIDCTISVARFGDVQNHLPLDVETLPSRLGIDPYEVLYFR